MSEYNEVFDKFIDSITEQANDAKVFTIEDFSWGGEIEIQNSIVHFKCYVNIEDGEISFVDDIKEACVLDKDGMSKTKNMEHWGEDELFIFKALIRNVDSIQLEIKEEAYRQWELK